MARNELTSKRISTIAGRVLKRLKECETAECAATCVIEFHGSRICKLSELKALAASALTQAANKPKRKRPTKRTIKRSK